MVFRIVQKSTGISLTGICFLIFYSLDRSLASTFQTCSGHFFFHKISCSPKSDFYQIPIQSLFPREISFYRDKGTPSASYNKNKRHLEEDSLAKGIWERDTRGIYDKLHRLERDKGLQYGGRKEWAKICEEDFILLGEYQELKKKKCHEEESTNSNCFFLPAWKIPE